MKNIVKNTLKYHKNVIHLNLEPETREKNNLNTIILHQGISIFTFVMFKNQKKNTSEDADVPHNRSPAGCSRSPPSCDIAFQSEAHPVDEQLPYYGRDVSIGKNILSLINFP